MLGRPEVRLIFTGFLIGLVLTVLFGIAAWIVTGSSKALVAAVVVAASAVGVVLVFLGTRIARRRSR